MIFENPDALWLLIAILPALFGLCRWGWESKKKAAALFLLDLRYLKKKHVEKYIMAGVLIILLILAYALPEIAFSSFTTQEKTGEIVLLVDVSTSMAAQEDIYTSSRLDRVKTILYEIIDNMELLGDVKLSLCGFTDRATSLVPMIGIEDYPYLRESIKRVLDINTTPGRDTSLGESIFDVTDKFSEGDGAKLIVVLSDGENYSYNSSGVSREEHNFREIAIQKAVYEGIKVITIGVGEQEGAKIPLYDSNGEFTGEYSQSWGEDYVSYFNNEELQNYSFRTGGKYFYEDNLSGLTAYIIENLNSVNTVLNTPDVNNYKSVAWWFLLVALPVWIILARRHLLW
jgi:Ca-activated chloride channel family protein